MLGILEAFCLLTGCVLLYRNEHKFCLLADLSGCLLLLVGVGIALYNWIHWIG